MQMNGMAELITIAKYWQDWADPRLVVSVLHNDDLNQVTWEMRAMGAHRSSCRPSSCPSVDYAGFARTLGLHGIDVDDPDDVTAAWDEAWPPTRPVRDRLPHRPGGTARSRRTRPGTRSARPPESVIRGDTDRLDVIKEGVKSKLQESCPVTQDGPVTDQ